MGIAVRQVFDQYPSFRSIKVRMFSPVIPGQTLRTEMWTDYSQPDLIVFQVAVIDTGKLCIFSGGVFLLQERGLDA